ncbi:hypothetical protein [Actinomadura hibisca]|uniref:hypothetical protein n=1 Tax=Actinomadura hibisca TaxID=68565 RepID=UPI000835AAE8|nr:hypothetical protein [Actinomadura hibisca]
MADSPSGDPGPDEPAAPPPAPVPPPPLPPAPWGASPPWWAADSDEDAPAAEAEPVPVTAPTPVTAPSPVEASGPQPVAGARPLPGPPATVMDFEPPSGSSPAIAVQALPSWEGTGPLQAVPVNAPGGVAADAQRRAVPKIGLAIGAVFALVMLVGVVVLATGGGEPKPRITAVATTAGLHKDAGTPAASAAYPFVSAGVRAGGVAGLRETAAVYGDAPAGTRNVLFMGGTGTVGDPAAFLARTRPSTFITAGKATDAGKAGGKTSCGTFAVLADVHAYCAWATEDSYGVVASNTPLLPAPPAALQQGPQPIQQPVSLTDLTRQLADLTRQMRADLEKRS